ncbi:MAG: hypothetical protein KDJ65_24395 [Anaerolineae bacterium]|nr:hypothetical protein [Anaerolineae bacterium]
MSKRDNIDVRIHSQEREWLQSLGGGSIVEGAKNLIRQLLDKNEDKDIYRGSYSRFRK